MMCGKWQIEEEPIYFGGQGITKGGQHWYFSTTHWRVQRGPPITAWREGYLFKLDCKSYKISAHRKIPFKELGYDHIGDLDFFDGLIYASFEDVNYAKPRVVLFKEEDLSVFSYSDLVDQSHLPWCVINPRDKLLYSSEFDPVTHINFFKLRYQDSADLVTKLKLKKPLHKVHGGCIHKNKLYVSCDDEVKGIYEIDLSSGDVLTLLETKIPHEMEGISADFSDKTVLHFIDHEGHFYHARRNET